jgi:hypothetical protein
MNAQRLSVSQRRPRRRPQRGLARRNSWPSALATGLVGWVGLTPLAALALGYAGPVAPLVGFGAAAAVVQIVALRGGFGALGLGRGLRWGAAWGTVTGGVLTAAATPAYPFLRQHPLLWLAAGAYIGLPVGAFLSYFRRDDRRLEAAAHAAGADVDYGRDAHWLEPFGFGALAYLLVLAPRTVDLAVYAFLVGAIAGVFAAGASHFSPDRWKQRWPSLVALVAAGAAPGAATGLLFRNFRAALAGPPALLGAAAGVLTFLVTLARGRVLARREQAAVG